MIILPDRNIPRARLLMPVHQREWREPSLAVFKDEFGNPGVRTRFRLTARLDDGFIKWRGWFDDRDDADAFLLALVSGSLRYERPLWKLPNVEWHPGLLEDVKYDFVTQTILTTTGSNQTYTSPTDWDNNSNQIECLGGGGSGSANRGGTPRYASGGGAGAYSAITNFSFATPGTTTATYRVGSGGAAVTRSSTGGTDGNAGGASWWNDSVDPGNGTNNTKCSAAAGAGGSQAGSAKDGGAAGSSWGQTKYSGGGSGLAFTTSGAASTGGGGAAGPSGDGGTSSSRSSAGSTGGGSANNGTTAGGSSGGNGSNGTEFSASYGCGSGGGGNNSGNGGNGGNYGAAGGAATVLTATTITSGAGRQGLIIVEYEPFVPSGGLGNMPMMGM